MVRHLQSTVQNLLLPRAHREDLDESMSHSKEEIEVAIVAKGEEIRQIKAEKAPTMKDDLEPLIAELLALKLSFKEVTGTDYGPPPKPKKVKGPSQEQSKKEGPSKKELNKLAAKAKKEAAKAEKAKASGPGTGPEAAGSGDIKSVASVSAAGDEVTSLYGDLPLIQSTTMTERIFVDVSDLSVSMADKEVWLRARVHTTRGVGKGCFFVLRQGFSTVQAIVWQGETVSKNMVKYASSISTESIVDVRAQVKEAPEDIQSCTQKKLELQVKEVHVMSKASDLPFTLEDASRSEDNAAATGMPTVLQDTCLNFRWVDMRTPANQAIFRIQSGVGMLFREFLYKNKFTEIHSPKLIAGASEGGSNVFTFQYFDRPACLAQSPQLYKQIAAACGGLERVFEVGPVFRAENSNTHRHLCEFTGLDFEMAITEHYFEALDLMGQLFLYIFDGIAERYHDELVMISQQYPFEPLQYHRPTLRLTYAEGIDMLRAAGHTDASYDDDISTPNEKALGALVKAKYGTDFYIMDKYPLAVRPFYTMPDPENPKLSNSYDLFIRGEEIVSGAQRIHDVDLLIERAKWWEIPLESIGSYVDSFRHGALPHAGGGIGLERVVMLYLGLKNIRKVSLFPRDPNRLSP